MMRRCILFVSVSLFLAEQGGSFAAETSGSSPKFGASWKSLLGEWKGEDPSWAASGVCGFHFNTSQQ
jgi:hypothetical protein